MTEEREDLTEEEKMELFFGYHEDADVVQPWDRNTATAIAKQVGIKLTDEQWEVVSFLRKHYQTAGPIEYARDISVLLDQRFKDKGGLKYLFSLFPKGPVSYGCKIAGIPGPVDATNESFGTSA
jgi:TusE/DsrC/DsvC family sulfur relay protein